MDENWMKFENSGSVSDYLNYRNRVEAEAELAWKRKEESGSERLYPSDRHGTAGGSYR
ncbi:MAG: hypothetical protein Q4G60_02770 [bacterium]|nr:hypothetical protein [bacterium]